jgi:hypothetical protein
LQDDKFFIVFAAIHPEGPYVLSDAILSLAMQPHVRKHLNTRVGSIAMRLSAQPEIRVNNRTAPSFLSRGGDW